MRELNLSTFTDSEGEAWPLSIDPFIGDRLAAVGIDITKALTGELFASFSRDASLVGKAAWIMADTNTVSEAEFYRRVGGRFADLLIAVIEAIAAFQVQPEVGSYIRELADAVLRADYEVLDDVAKSLAALRISHAHQSEDNDE